jgi:biopolymer transport protein ExbD
MIFITPTIVGEQTQPEAEQLAQVDDQIARDLRKSEKSSFGQLFSSAVRGKNEILVSIGQSGSIRCDGKQMTLDDLRKRFDAVKVPAAVLVVLRKNARAPEDVVSSVTDLALEKRLRVESDSRLNAFVPDYGAQEEQAPKSPPAQEESKPPENAPTAPATPEPEKPAESAAK